MYWPRLIDDRNRAYKYFRLSQNLRLSEELLERLSEQSKLQILIQAQTNSLTKRTNKDTKLREAFSCICAHLCISLINSEGRGSIVPFATYLKGNKIKPKSTYVEIHKKKFFSAKELKNILDYLSEIGWLKQATGGTNPSSKGLLGKINSATNKKLDGNLTKVAPTSDFAVVLGEDFLDQIQSHNFFKEDKEKLLVCVVKKRQQVEGVETIYQKLLTPEKTKYYSEQSYSTWTKEISKLNSKIDQADIRVEFQRVPRLWRERSPNYLDGYQSFISAIAGDASKVFDDSVPQDPYIHDREYGYVKLSSADLHYRRIFSKDFKTGGRLFGRITDMPKVFRHTMLINEKQTLELDWKAMFPSILFSLERKPIPEDPYLVTKNIPREIAKIIVNIAINCSSKKTAIRAVQNELNKSGKKLPSGMNVKDSVEIVENSLPEISGYFYELNWGRLQYIESEVACGVISRLLNENILALPVHDSFIVQNEHTEQAKAAMKEAYQVVLAKELGSETIQASTIDIPKITVKETRHGATLGTSVG